MNSEIIPLYPRVEKENLDSVRLKDTRLLEPREEWLSSLLRDAVELQHELSNIPLSERLKAVQLIGDAWRKKLEEDKLYRIKEGLVKATGYSPSLVEMEMKLVTEVFNPGNVRKVLDSGLVGGSRSLEEPVEVAPGELIRNLPIGPVLVIGSGNSIIPPLIPTVLSLTIGNFTILRPSLANFEAVKEVYSALEELPEDNPLRRALLVSYFTHESRNLMYLLERAPIGLVNYWGGEPGRTAISRAVAANRYRPRLILNGPMTGFALIDSANATVEVAEKLALEMVLYDQQLCSSPTQAAFLGSREDALQFAEMVCSALDKVGGEHPLSLESIPYPLFVLRKSLELVGAKVYASSNPRNPWTLVLAGKRSVLDKVPQNTIIPFYARKRFLELVVVQTLNEAMELIRNLPENPAYTGVDKVQTLSVAVSGDVLKQVTNSLHLLGVYRVVPLGESFLRTPVEPYDGFFIPSAFSYAAYVRVR